MFCKSDLHEVTSDTMAASIVASVKRKISSTHKMGTCKRTKDGKTIDAITCLTFYSFNDAIKSLEERHHIQKYNVSRDKKIKVLKKLYKKLKGVEYE